MWGFRSDIWLFPEKCQLYQIKNCQLAIINFKIPDIWQTVPDIYLDHYYKIKCVASRGDMDWKISNSIKFKMADLRPSLILISVLYSTWQTVVDSYGIMVADWSLVSFCRTGCLIFNVFSVFENIFHYTYASLNGKRVFEGIELSWLG